MPSIGSTTQRTPLVPGRARRPPRPARRRPGRAPSSRPTISSSLARSTAVTTSTGLDFTSTCSAGRAPGRGRPARPPPGRCRRRGRAARAGSGRGRTDASRRRSCPTRPPRRDPPRACERGRRAGSLACRRAGLRSGHRRQRHQGLPGRPRRAASSIGERVRIETPQPSLPDAVYAVVGADRRLRSAGPSGSASPSPA